jgi:excinuclease ABC subunit C
MVSTYIAEQHPQLPTDPGVYLMRDNEGNILYVGKAANLRKRVRSYFSIGQKLSPKLQRLVARVNDLDFFVTNTEQEALILELNLIKSYHPRYNVRLKDDKTFPYLKIDPNQDWPRIHITRRLEEDGGHYFGPFASAKSVRQTLKAIKGIFPFRSCSKQIAGNDRRPCLEYHINHCLGPCISAVTREEYSMVIKQIICFLEGKQEIVIQELKTKMEKAAKTLDFERAALLRDQIQAIDRIIEGQRIATAVRGEQDVIALASEKDHACVQVFFIRNSRIIGRESFVVEGTRYESQRQIMTNFIKQFYNSCPYIPPLLLVQYPLEDALTIKNWLQTKKGAKVRIQVPCRGNKKQLASIVAENARQSLAQLRIKQLAAPDVVASALTEVKKELNLPSTPLRMEGYDISNLQGKMAVGSMVIFVKGKPKPTHYRRFKIKTVPSTNDYAMLQEVLKRRFKRGKESLGTWAILPDLVLIDGGKGQLGAARAIMTEIGVNSIPIASLAKENEEIFIPQKTKPIILPRISPGLQLLQHLRDEAHRFALGYHQKIHKRETINSTLDTIAGIGPSRKRALLKRFGSFRAIRRASIEELTTTKGISLSLAKKLSSVLN